MLALVVMGLFGFVCDCVEEKGCVCLCMCVSVRESGCVRKWEWCVYEA